MRNSTPAQRAITAARRMRRALKVEMQGLDGLWRELTNLNGRNWVTGANWLWNLDQPVMSGSLSLHRAVGAASLAPLMLTSTLNQTGAGDTAGPQLDVRRRVRISTYTQAADIAPFNGIGGVWSQSGTNTPTLANFNNGIFTDAAFHTDTAVPGAYVQVDMGAAVTFDQVSVWLQTSAGAAIYKVRGSPDGAVWTDIRAGFQPTTVGENRFSFPSSSYRYWRLELTNTPGSGPWVGEVQFNRDWREMFNGYTDKYDEGGDKPVITVPMRDLGALLQNTVIETERIYGSAAGIDGAVVMNQILSDNADILGVLIPLVVPVAIPVAVRTYKLSIGTSIMDALNAIARKAGAVVRYEYDANQVAQLTFFRPDKSKVVPDNTFAASEYLSLDELSADIAGLRNVVAVPFTDSAPGGTGRRLVAWAYASPENLEQYGRLTMILGQDVTDQINSMVEAQTLADTARDDTSFPYATAKATHRLTWWVQGGDLLRYASDGRHSSSNLDIGVMQYEHSFSIVGDEVQARTTIIGRPNIATLYHTWLRLSQNAIDEAVSGSQTPNITVTLVGGDNTTVLYQIDAQMPDGSDVSAIFWALGVGPLVNEIASGDVITIPRATNHSSDRLLLLRAVGTNGLSTDDAITVDYDLIPSISSVAEAAAIYSAGEQIGWRLKGAVDDDTRALVIALTSGLTFSAATPAGAVGVDGNYWMDTSTLKTFVIDLLQDPGQRGTVTLTPREFYNSVAGGLGGQPYIQTLDRPGISVATTRDIDSTTREVTITARPDTATVNYRIDGGIWHTATGKVTLTLDVASADRVVEFYSTTASGGTEAIKRLVVDQNHQPSITSLVVTESTPNNIHVSAGFDDDVVLWRLWARRQNWPTLLASGDPAIWTPADEYKRYDSGMEKTALDFRAGGNGDGSSTWFIIVRAYDDAGSYVEQHTSILVSGAPPVAGSLSNVRAVHAVEGGLNYNDILWDHNDTVQSTTHTVTVRESDNGAAFVQLVIGRDARLEEDGGAVVADVGGYRTQKPWVAPGTAGAVFHTYDYQVDLRLASDNSLIATYTCSMSGWEAGGGGGGGGSGSAPTEVATTLAPVGEQLQASASWVNTNSTAGIRIEWQKWNGAAWAAYSSYNLTAATTTHTQAGLTAGDLMRFRVIYYNGFGDSTGGYATSGSVTVQAAGSAPTEQPSDVNILNRGGGVARAVWNNTSSAYQLRIYFEMDTTPYTQHDLPAGTTQYDESGLAGHDALFHIDYFNSVGEGPQSTSPDIPIT